MPRTRPRDLCLIATALALAAGCATGPMSPEARLRSDLYWDAARQCESRYRTLHLDRIDLDGNVSMHADADTRADLEPFRKCYRDTLKTEVEHRQQAGLAVPAMPPREPSADLD